MDKDTLIEQLIKEKGGTREQYLSLLNQIAYHESAHTMDPTIKQRGGGPGRGVYQFEEGKDAGGITAARRTAKYLKSKGEKIPDWLNKATKGDSLDATKLTKEQQDILFLGNMRMHPKADFSNYVSGKESTEDFWANYHWAGKAVDREDRLAAFDTSREDYKKKYNQELDSTKPRKPIINQPAQQRYQAVADNIQQPQQQQVEPQLEQYPLHKQRAVDLYSYMNSGYQDQKFNEFNGGGTHEQNPQGGIPQGIGANGQQNKVEEGETSYDFKDKGKYVFSDRIDLFSYVNSNKTKKQSNQFADGGSLNNCGGPGQPPCDDKVREGKLNQLDEVLLKYKTSDPRIVSSKNDPRYQAFQDSTSAYNATAKDGRSANDFYIERIERNNKSWSKSLEAGDYKNEAEKKKIEQYIIDNTKNANRLKSIGRDHYLNKSATSEYDPKATTKNISGYGTDNEYGYVSYGYADERIDFNKENMPPLIGSETAKAMRKGLVPQQLVNESEGVGIGIFKKPKEKIFLEGTPEADIARKQLLLQKRGTYDGLIDGIWGKASSEALSNTNFMSKEGRPKFQDLNFGKYKDYFKIKGMAGETIMVENTSSNPHNPQTIKEIERKIRKLNPGKKFKLSYKK